MNFNDIILPLHLVVLAFVAWTIFQADRMAFAWVRGQVATLDEAKIARIHRRTWFGLIGMIVTGLILFWGPRDYLLQRPQFYAKMLCVAALLINGAAIGALQKVAFEKPYSELSWSEKWPLVLSGAVSTLGWMGAGILAFFLLP